MKKVSSVCKKLHAKMTRRWWIMTIYQVITLILSIIMVYGVVNYAVTKSYRGRKLYLSSSFTVTAHTGSMDTLQNSIESIEKAISIGADVTEFDVRFRPDGTPVMAHDPVYSNKKGVPVEDAFKSLTQPGVTIKINLDIKETDHLDKLQALVLQYGLKERAFLTGVGESFVPHVKEKCPQLSYYLNYSPSRSRLIGDKYPVELLALLKESGAIGINCSYMYSSERLAELLHENGYLLSVWTVNNEDKMARTLVNGADNITSLSPDKLIHLIDTWND